MCIDENIHIGMFLQVWNTQMSFFTNIQLTNIVLDIWTIMRKFHIMPHQWLTTKIVPYMMEEDKMLELLMPKVVDAMMFSNVGFLFDSFLVLQNCIWKKKGYFHLLCPY